MRIENASCDSPEGYLDPDPDFDPDFDERAIALQRFQLPPKGPLLVPATPA